MSLHETKKFYLDDASELKNPTLSPNVNFKERTKPLINKELHYLDQIMSSIINNETLSQEDKVREYNKALAKYQETRENINQPLNLNLNNVTSEIKKYNPLFGISKIYKNKANQLWSLLENNDDLRVQDNGEVIIKDRRIQGSNLSDLINTAVNKKFKGYHLPGWSDFQQLLIQGNIPRSIISTDALVVEPTKVDALAIPSPDILNNWSAHDDSKETDKEKRKKKRRSK